MNIEQWHKCSDAALNFELDIIAGRPAQYCQSDEAVDAVVDKLAVTARQRYIQALQSMFPDIQDDELELEAHPRQKTIALIAALKKA